INITCKNIIAEFFFFNKLIMEYYIILNSKFRNNVLKILSVCFSMFLFYHRMRGAQNKVNKVRMLIYNIRKGFEHTFDTFVLAQQAESEDKWRPFEIQHLFILITIAKRIVRHPMEDDLDFVFRNCITIF